MGSWIELGVFVLALAFGLWQLHDVKQAREASRRERAQAPGQGQGAGDTGRERAGPGSDGLSGPR